MTLIEMSRPWAENREQKAAEKIPKYGPFVFGSCSRDTPSESCDTVQHNYGRSRRLLERRQ